MTNAQGAASVPPSPGGEGRGEGGRSAHFKFDIRHSAFVIACVARAVHYAHQRGILHRDLKPGNILLDERGEPHVTDFGLARLIDDDRSLTQSGVIMGTPSYMAPEQAAGKVRELTTATDVYSLGAILYELLTGQPPFRGDSPVATLQKVLEADPPTVCSRNAAVDADLETICLKCLSKDPKSRYGTAEFLALDLERWLRREPIEARPITQTERLWRWCRRQPVLAGLGATVLMLLITVAIVSSVAAWRVTGARNAERQQWERAERNAAEEARQRHRAEDALIRMELQRAEELLAANDSPSALAYLASVLRQQPSNRVAATRLLTALTQRTFALPISGPMVHMGGVVSAEFSPDGNRVLTACEDGTARIWDAQTSLPLKEPLRHQQALTGAHFSRDGQRVLTASRDNTARVWDAATGLPLTDPFSDGAAVVAAQFSPDGERVATVSANRSARIWGALTGKPLCPRLVFGAPGAASIFTQALTGFTEGFVEFSLDGSILATGFADRVASLWDGRTGQRLVPALLHENAAVSARFNLSGTKLFTSDMGRPRWWSSRTGEPLDVKPPPQGTIGAEAGVWFSQISSDGESIVSLALGRMKTARLWDVHTGAPTTDPLPHDAEVVSAQFSPDGKRVATVTTKHAVRVWDTQTGKPLTEPLQHASRVTSVEFSRSNQWLLTASRDKTAVVWDIRPGAARPTPIDTCLTNDVAAARLSPDGQKFLLWMMNSNVVVGDARTGERLSEVLKHAGSGPSRFRRGADYFAEFSPDGKRLATGDPATVRLWNQSSGWQQIFPSGIVYSTNVVGYVNVFTNNPAAVLGLLRQLSGSNETSSAFFARFSADGQRLAAFRPAGAIVWDLQAAPPLSCWLEVGGAVRASEFSPDGRRIVIITTNCVRVWSTDNAQPLTPPLLHDAEVLAARFSPDGERLFTATTRALRVWSSRTGQAVASPVTVGNDAARAKEFPALAGGLWTDAKAAVFSSDARRLVVLSSDRTARLWDVATGRPVTEALPHDSVHPRILPEFSADNSRLFTVASEAVIVRDAETGHLLSGPIVPEPGPLGGWKPLTQFNSSADGQRLFTLDVLNSIRVWDVPAPALSVPPWLPTLAEFVAGKKTSERRVVEAAPSVVEFLALKQQLLASGATDASSHWARWFLSDRLTRPFSPLADMSERELTQWRARNKDRLIEAAADKLSDNGLPRAAPALAQPVN